MSEFSTASHVAAKTVFEAYENERCIDLNYRSKLQLPGVRAGVPNYKVMKQLSLQRRLGSFYILFVRLAVIAVPLLTLGQWLTAILIAAIPVSQRRHRRIHLIATARATEEIMWRSLETEGIIDRGEADTNLLGVFRLARELGVRGMFDVYRSCLTVYTMIERATRDERMDLLLHSRDVLLMTMLAHYILAHRDEMFVTDTHYERHIFILSRLGTKVFVVQHGYLDGNIHFRNQFGPLRALYVRDRAFEPIFKHYFSVGRVHVVDFKRPLTRTPHGKNSVFLASSAPFIDVEIALARLLRDEADVPLLIKFHPQHLYDARRATLAALASYECGEDEYPECGFFVSYNSFLEYDYRANGIRTFSIGQSDTTTIAHAIATEMHIGSDEER